MKINILYELMYLPILGKSSIWPTDSTLSAATTLAQSEPRSNGNEGVLHITGTSPSDGLVSYPGNYPKKKELTERKINILY